MVERKTEGGRCKRVIVALCLLVFSGCTLAPEYTRPQTPVPGVWPAGPASGGPTGEPGLLPAETSWRDFIPHERLRRVIDIALLNNRDLRVATLNVERARALYRIQRAELLPSLEAGALYSKERVPGAVSGNGEPSTKELYSVDAAVSAWEIDLFGRVRSLKDAALQEYLATEEARGAVRIVLIAEVANAYLAWAADRELLRLAQETLKTYEETYRLTRRRHELGASSELDVRQAQTQLEAARVDRERYTALVAADGNALMLLCGAPIGEELAPEDLDTVGMLRPLAAGLPADVLLRRPDIRRAERLLDASYANIGAARAAFFPRITLTTSVGTASDELSGLFASGSDTWSFIPHAVMPIFDARTWAAYDVANVERDIRLAEYERAIQAAFREVADALAQRGALDSQTTAQQALVEAAAESYRLAELRYKSGIDSYLNVLDAQRTLYAAQRNLIGIRLARLANLVTLYKVLGGGVSE